jgi:hypothetical protein
MAHRLKLDKPAFYHIQVQGTLSPRWADYLGDLKVAVNHQQDPPCTTLEGVLIDQAALMGILNSLYNLGFPILAVEYDPTRREI